MIGLSAADLMRMDVDQRMAAIADKVKQLGLSAQQTGDLLRQFGVRNENLALTLLEGGDAFRSAREEIKKFGLEIDGASAARVESANDAIERMKFVFEGLRTTLAIQIAPALQDVAERFQTMSQKGGPLHQAVKRLATGFGELIEKLSAPEFIETATTIGVSIANAVSTLSGLVVILTNHADLAATAMIGLGAAMAFLSGPVGLSLALVSGGLLLLSGRADESEAAMARFQTSVDNTVLAMADEIRQSQTLRAELGAGTVMSERAAKAKLEEARAHREAIAAKLEESRTTLIQSDDYTKISADIEGLREKIKSTAQFIAEQEALLKTGTAGVFAGRIGSDVAIRSRELSDLKAQLIGLLQQRQEMLHAVTVGLARGDEELQQLDATIAELEKALAAAENGVVDLGDGLVVPVELGERLSEVLGGISVSGIDDAERLAKWLGVSLDTARKLAAMGPQGVPDEYTGPISSGRGGDPREAGGSAFDWQNREADEFLKNWKPPVSGGGSSATSKASDAQKKYNDLLREARRIKEGLKTAEERHAEALAAANEMQEAGMLTMAEYTRHVGELNDELNKDRIDALTDGVDRLTDALFEGKKGVIGFVKTALLEMAKLKVSNGIRSLMGLPTAPKRPSILGSILGNLIGFADGGSFNVGGAGGVDSQMVAFKASPNERVHITKPGQGLGTQLVNGLLRVSIEPSGEFDARVESISGPLAVDVAGKMIGNNNKMLSQSQRRS